MATQHKELTAVQVKQIFRGLQVAPCHVIADHVTGVVQGHEEALVDGGDEVHEDARPVDDVGQLTHARNAHASCARVHPAAVAVVGVGDQHASSSTTAHEEMCQALRQTADEGEGREEARNYASVVSMCSLNQTPELFLSMLLQVERVARTPHQTRHLADVIAEHFRWQVLVQLAGDHELLTLLLQLDVAFLRVTFNPQSSSFQGRCLVDALDGDTVQLARPVTIDP